MKNQPPLKRFLVKLFIVSLVLINVPVLCPEAKAPIISDTNTILREWTRENLTDMIYSVSRAEGWAYPELIIGLAQYESIWLTVPRILDTNQKYSTGLYHFQDATFQSYCVKKFHLDDDIMDPVVQTKCAIRMGKLNLIHTSLGWQNSYKKITK